MRLFRLFIKNYSSKTEPINEAIDDKITKIKGTKILKLIEINDEPTKNELIEFIKGKESINPSDIADALRFSLEHAFRIVNELFREGRVEKAG